MKTYEQCKCVKKVFFPKHSKQALASQLLASFGSYVCVGFCVHFWPLLLSPNVRKCNSAVAKPCSLVLHTKVITCVRRRTEQCDDLYQLLYFQLIPECVARQTLQQRKRGKQSPSEDLETKVEAGTQRRKGRETALVMNCVEIRFFSSQASFFPLRQWSVLLFLSLKMLREKYSVKYFISYSQQSNKCSSF